MSHVGIQLPEKAISCHRTTIKYGLSSQQDGKRGQRKECLESSFRKSFPKSPVNPRKDHRGLKIILKEREHTHLGTSSLEFAAALTHELMTGEGEPQQAKVEVNGGC